jgi:hypothetical protein
MSEDTSDPINEFEDSQSSEQGIEEKNEILIPEIMSEK